ncbi:MAG: restriction endonuclease subunit S [Candidatus Cloacimonetes bacterium]|nr:restriction endonuclease subunit S [Candidatus Cloacimonadota bacterium]
MADKWKTMQFSDAVQINPKSPVKKGEVYPFVDMKAIEPNNRSVTTLIEREFKGGGSKFIDGDTLMARITPCLENGKIARYKSVHEETVAHGSTEFIVIRGKPDITDSLFVYYLTRWDEVRNYAISQMSGTSGRQRVPNESLDHLEISIPPITEQKAIAHVLGTLDDKIELNRRMNETLESITQAIFKSWFVDFDPVRAKAEGRDTGLPKEIAALFPDSFEESELGEIPKGWEVVNLSNVIKIFDSKRVPLSARERLKRQGTYPYYGATSIMDYIDDYLFDGTYILVAEDGSVVDKNDNPVVQYVWGKFWVNNHAHILKGTNGISNEHLMLFLKQVYIHPYITGAVQLKLNQGNLNRIPFIKPQRDLCDMFSKTLDSLFSKYKNNIEMNLNLEIQRDGLLPKLLTGEIRLNHS